MNKVIIKGYSKKKSKSALFLILDGDRLMHVGHTFYQTVEAALKPFEKQNVNHIDVSGQVVDKSITTIELFQGILEVEVTLTETEKLWNNLSIPLQEVSQRGTHQPVVIEEAPKSSNMWTNSDTVISLTPFLEIEKKTVVKLMNKLIKNEVKRNSNGQLVLDGIIKKAGDKTYFSLDK